MAPCSPSSLAFLLFYFNVSDVFDCYSVILLSEIDSDGHKKKGNIYAVAPPRYMYFVLVLVQSTVGALLVRKRAKRQTQTYKIFRCHLFNTFYVVFIRTYKKIAEMSQSFFTEPPASNGQAFCVQNNDFHCPLFRRHLSPCAEQTVFHYL